MHPSFELVTAYTFQGDPLDCSYLNTNPDWGEPGPLNDPSLDRDELVGLGAEVTTIEDLEVERARPPFEGYLVAVVAYGVPEGLQARALVRVFEDGELFAERSSRLQRTGDVWLVGRLMLTAELEADFW